MRPLRIIKYTLATLAFCFLVQQFVVAQPTDILLSSSDVDENQPINTIVGNLTAVPAIPASTFSIVAGDMAYFGITGNNLVTKAVFDFETKETYNITIQASNIGGSYTEPFTITINDINDAPVLSGIEPTILPYDEEDDPVEVTSNLTVTDEDNNNIISATVTISSGRVSTEDRLALTSTPFISTRIYDIPSGVLTITGAGTPAQYTTALRDVTYENINEEDPDEGTRTITFRVVDIGAEPSNTQSRNLEVNGVNDPPVATNVVILGTNDHIGTLQTGYYDYDDPEDGTAEGESTYQWYSANTSGGAGSAPLTGETNLTFTPDYTEGGKYIQFEVTPVDPDDLAGDPAGSAWKYINAAPVFTDLTVENELHPGVFAVGETVKAITSTYFDKELNPPGTHTYQWYRSYNETPSWPATAIPGQTGSTYTLVPADNDKNIAVRVVPYATIGSSPGEADTSAWYPVGELPSATISGDVTICEGSEGTLTVTLTGNNPPWAFSYSINGGSAIEVTGVGTSPHDLAVTEAGTYELVEVSDDEYDFGTVSGEGTVSYHPAVSATLTEEEYYVCEGDEDEHELPVTLTGTSPWIFYYRKIGDPPADSAMQESTGTSSFIPVTAEDLGTFEILHVWDANCMAEGTGTTEVILRTSPIATLSGDTAVCPGGEADLSVELTGTGPWTIWYTLDGGTETDVDVTSHPAPYSYKLHVTESGLYELTGVSDTENEGCAYGTANVTERTLPTATISGDETICEGTDFDINVTLTGVPPWKFTYQYEAEDPDSISGILQSPYLLTIEEEGTYEVIKVKDKYCTNPASGGQVEITIQPAPEVTLDGLEEIYDIQAIPETLSIDPAGGNFDDSDFPGAIIPISGNWIFYPSIAWGAYGSPFRVVYSWQDPSTTCIGKAMDTVLIVSKAAEIQVKNYHDTIGKRYCFNDEAILIQGVNIRQEIGSFSIEGDEGLVDTDPNDNEAYLIPSIIQSGTRTVTYSVYFPGEGWKYASKDFTFQKIDADFSWDNECFGDGESLVNFYDNSDVGSAVLNSHHWIFYFPENVVFREGSSTSLTFEQMTTYPIDYIIGSQNGCYDTISKDLILKPTIEVFESPYLEDFTDGRSSWYSYSVNSEGLNSWKFGRPLGETFNAETGTKAWYTDVQNILSGEQSYVVSPCYDFSESSRPVIRMDIWRAFASIDGAVLQYTLDNGENWFEVGAIGDGIYWYNEYNIFGIPGGQGLGWTNKKDANWVKARHKLDMLEGESLVRFRIAYGAPNGYPDERDGIAFDNIWIGERTKKVLIEHFTNAGDTLCKRINQEFNTLVNSNGNLKDIIDIQYHMGYPGTDTFYILNSGPSDTREYYYGLSNVPYAFIDGGRNGMHEYIVNYREEDLEQIDLTLSVLYDNPFLFNMNTVLGDNALTVNLDVEAAEDFEEKALTVYVVIIERLIKDVVGANGEDRFESVVRDMLPNSQGTTLTRSWNAGDKEHMTFDWFFQDVFDEEELRIVAFIQDDITKEVYQAEIINPYGVNGIEDIGSGDANRMDLYPNPAYTYVNVRLKEQLREPAIVKLTDYTGRVVYSKKLNPGEQLIHLPLERFDSGLYIVTLYDERDILFSEKLIVIDNK
ncbi:MAG: T9SS type A sorting domain-containing protein [Bacteroidales bacterium]|nr:T9SS type A sorting domain-containing protein [Bacteroidales bacterium]